MKTIRFLLLTLVVIISPSATLPTQVMTWQVQPNSTITINGSSNINKFGCDIVGGFRSQPLQSQYNQQSKTSMKATLKGLITVDIQHFDCKNKLITNDLRKTLKADQYPTMTIHFLELERLPDIDSDVDFLSGKVLIVLAGQQRQFYLRFAFNKTAEGYHLLGSRAFTFSDFDLKPPAKVGGLIKVKDEFDVGFTLVLRTI